MKIETKIDFWKKKLLDLGKRNKLINFTISKTGQRVSRSAIMIETPSADELWDALSNFDSNISFPVVTKADKNIDISEGQLEFDKEPNDESPIFTNGYKTNQMPYEACKTFRALMHKSKEFMDNKGLNALYLSFGFLNWKENGLEGQVLRSPILLIPVCISQDNVSAPFVISRIDSEIVSNNTLLYKLKNDFNIEIPEYNEDTNWKTYLKTINDECLSLGWDVDYECVQLSMITFQKMAMYSDIEQNAESIANNPIVRIINGDTDEVKESDYSDIDNYDHDSTDPKDVSSVVDADSSQQDAILLAKRGASFVLQGPPGTGKSQTITNIIAELLAQGKSVLFVSEKLAALQVVYNRLSAAGVNDFCLTLHNPNAKRREIMDQLQNSINLASEKVTLNRKAVHQLNQLVTERQKLNSYVKELHTIVPPLNENIYRVNGYISSLEAYPDIDYVYKNAVKVSAEELHSLISMLTDYSLIIQKDGYQQYNPWQGSNLNTVTNLFRQKFSSDTSKLSNSVNNGKEIYSTLIALVGESNLSDRICDLDNWQLLFEHSLRSPHISYDITSKDINKVCELVSCCQDSLQKKKQAYEAQAKADAFINEADDVVHKIYKCVFQNEIDSLNDLELEYDSIFSKIGTELYLDRFNPVSDDALLYRQSCVSYAELFKNDTDLKTQKANIESECSKIEEELSSEEKLLSEMKDKMLSAQNVVTNEYNDGILDIDADALLGRYKNDYSSITRIVKSSFKNDSKEIRGFSKSNKKPSYSQTIELLNSIITAQHSKKEHDDKVESVEKIKDKRSRLLSDLSSITTQISNSTIQLQNSKTSVIDNQRNIINKLDGMRTAYKNTANERKIQCDGLYKEASECINKTVNDFTDFKSLHNDILWLKEFAEICDRFEIGNSYRHQICELNDDYNDRLNTVFRQFMEWKIAYKELCDSLLDSFDDNTTTAMSNLRMQELHDKITVCSNSYSMLEYYIDYKHLISKMESTGVLGYIKKVEELELPSDNIIPCFKKCFFRSWLDDVIPQFEAVATFRGEKQEAIISDFKSLDKEQMEIAKAYLKAKLISRLPNLDSFIVGGTEVSILRRELAKQRKLMPLRKLIAVLPTLLPALKPCIMMSPLSVSTYFRNTDYKFDTVIFDEASQVRTEDAICSIFRGSQVIIAGDSKQLPPTDFFSASFTDSDEFSEDEDGFDDAGAYESLLDEASSLPTQTLLWHYRSKNEQLIAFSNQKIYNGNLITFPSAVEKGKDIGVEYIYTKNGIYDRGGRNGNRVEAEKVAELVFEHIKNNGNRSLGIIAFNEKQQTIIEDVIIRKRQENPQYEYFFKDSENEPFFIRNLETVQGDERDTIIFSIGFGYDKYGKFLMNFGPLSKSGGERRLNVAITRARYNLKLVGSIVPTDINVDKVNSLGPKLLRQYIDYAINGPKAIIAEIQADETISFDSPFEESVYTFLVDQGYNVATQVGCSGYRIDMAIRHPDYNGRFAIGIECDGAAYHSARTARERDRLRQAVLESMGWKIHRIWSTDWIKDPNAERKKLLDAVEKAISNYQETYSMTDNKTENDKQEQYLNVSEADVTDQISDYLKVKSAYAGMNVQDVPIKDIENTILKVLEIGYGYDMDTLIKSTAKYGYTWQRTGKNIKARFTMAFNRLINKEAIIVENGIIKIKK